MTPPAMLLYDGDCGFCHAWVRVLLRLDRDGRHFRFTPLQGEKAKSILAPETRRALGDTVLVQTQEGRLLGRTDAVLYIGRRLGGVWALGAALLAIVPKRVRDAGYDAVARIRHRLFAKPEGACPILPPNLRARFDD